MLADILFFAISGVIIFVVYKFVFKKKQEPIADPKKQEDPPARNVQPEPEVVNANPRNVRNRFANQRNVNLDDDQEEEKEDQVEEDDDGNPLNKSKKQLQKESKKQAQKEQQEAFKQMLEAKEKKENEKRNKYEEREKQREEEEKKQEEIQRQLEEEQRKKEEEEYNKWKDMIMVEEEGTDAIDPAADENLLQKFVDYITIRKVVMLEDLANDFKLQTKDVIDRIERLIASKKLSGIIDDRGKFIYITEDEFKVAHKNSDSFKAVMNFIKKKGRISRSDLIFECNKLIKLNPSEEDKKKLKQEQSNLLKQIEVDMNSINETPAS